MKKRIIVLLIILGVILFVKWWFFNQNMNSPRYVSYIYDSNIKSLNYIIYGGENNTIKYIEDDLFYLVKTNYGTINIIQGGNEIREIGDLIMSFSDVRNDTIYSPFDATDNDIQFFYDSITGQSNVFVLHSFYVGKIDSVEINRFIEIKDSLISTLK